MATPQRAAKRTTPAAPHNKKPYGHYTARLLKRLPITRFRRCTINRPAGKWLHPNAAILIGIRMRCAVQGWRHIPAQGMATGERDR
jgi:hypothetical protein